MTQAEICFDAPCRVPDHGTQSYEILKYLQSGRTLTVAKAMAELSVYALSQRCGELRRMGWPIKSRMVELHPGTRVAEYSL
jgi:predicted DNA-binding transcriptional regulator YafY